MRNGRAPRPLANVFERRAPLFLGAVELLHRQPALALARQGHRGDGAAIPADGVSLGSDAHVQRAQQDARGEHAEDKWPRQHRQPRPQLLPHERCAQQTLSSHNALLDGLAGALHVAAPGRAAAANVLSDAASATGGQVSGIAAHAAPRASADFGDGHAWQRPDQHVALVRCLGRRGASTEAQPAWPDSLAIGRANVIGQRPPADCARRACAPLTQPGAGDGRAIQGGGILRVCGEPCPRFLKEPAEHQ
mmetsp:Transcript_47608/g.125663  ORF Transcript_47608/g.125663 Transcript_47608/m.125663 type:complete len:249 (+) Transcript_47608:717-1463(+)